MGSDRRAGRVRRGFRAWHPWMWLEKHKAVAIWSLTSVFDTSKFSSSSAALGPTGAWVNFQRTSQVVQRSGLCLKWSTSVSQFLQGQIQKGARWWLLLCVFCFFLVWFSFSLFIFWFLSGRLGFPGLTVNPWTLGCWPYSSYHYARAQLTPSLHP